MQILGLCKEMGCAVHEKDFYFGRLFEENFLPKDNSISPLYWKIRWHDAGVSSWSPLTLGADRAPCAALTML